MASSSNTTPPDADVLIAKYHEQKAAHWKLAREASLKLRKQRTETNAMLYAQYTEIIHGDTASPAQKLKAADLLSKLVTPKGKKKLPKPITITPITKEEVVKMAKRVASEPGYEVFIERTKNDPGGFLEEFKVYCERSLYLFTKYILDNPDMTPVLHKQMASFIQTQGESRNKLMLIPVDHLKTTVGSQGFAIHALIQPASRNVYIPNLAGANTRIMLGGEIVTKAGSNLDVIMRHFKDNRWLRALWPHISWENPEDQSPKWTNTAIEVKGRTKTFSEQSVMTFGVGTSLHQYHFDIIILDDIITLKTISSPRAMEKADIWRKSIHTRLSNPETGIILGIGTRWDISDIYSDWLAELGPEDLMLRMAIESQQPIWPERFTLAKLNTLRKNMGDRLFSLQYMNMPISNETSTLVWDDIREFNFTDNGKTQLEFYKNPLDQKNAARYAIGNRAKLANLRRGQPLSLAYPSRPRGIPIDPWRQGVKSTSGNLDEGPMFVLQQKYGPKGERLRKNESNESES